MRNPSLWFQRKVVQDFSTLLGTKQRTTEKRKERELKQFYWRIYCTFFSHQKTFYCLLNTQKKKENFKDMIVLFVCHRYNLHMDKKKLIFGNPRTIHFCLWHWDAHNNLDSSRVSENTIYEKKKKKTNSHLKNVKKYIRYF